MEEASLGGEVAAVGSGEVEAGYREEEEVAMGTRMHWVGGVLVGQQEQEKIL